MLFLRVTFGPRSCTPEAGGSEGGRRGTIRGIVKVLVSASYLAHPTHPKTSPRSSLAATSVPCRPASVGVFHFFHAPSTPFFNGDPGKAQKEDQKHLLRETETTMKFGLFSMVQVKSSTNEHRPACPLARDCWRRIVAVEEPTRLDRDGLGFATDIVSNRVRSCRAAPSYTRPHGCLLRLVRATELPSRDDAGAEGEGGLVRKGRRHD